MAFQKSVENFPYLAVKKIGGKIQILKFVIDYQNF